MLFICWNRFVKNNPGLQHIDKKIRCNGRNNIPIQIVEKLRTIGQVFLVPRLPLKRVSNVGIKIVLEFFCNFRYRHFICFNGIYWGGFLYRSNDRLGKFDTAHPILPKQEIIIGQHKIVMVINQRLF